MNILYTLNDAFVPQVAAGICSVCENNKLSKKITFYLISYGISTENKERLKKLVESYHRNIDIIELKNMNSYFDFDFDTMGWNPIVLARLLVDKLLPVNIDRVLYLDGDTIVRNDITDYYNMDLNNKTIAMSIEPTIDKDRIKNLKMGNHPYCNAGVLLIDMERWRKIKAGKKIIEFYRKNNGRLFANDQDAINGSMKEEITIVSPTYNYYNIFDQYSYRFLSKNMKPINYTKYVTKEDYSNAKSNPSIIHYLGEERPWRKGNTHKYRKDYKKYLQMTYWKDTKDEEGWKLYFVCWKIFNFLTKPFPSIRLRIINSLIPKFMKLRSKKLKKKKEDEIKMKKTLSDIQIYIAAHKKFNLPNNKMYLPLHVGAEGKQDLGYVSDATGDNISKKNPNYCELTGLYWIWKNSKAKVTGLVHYRRYFYKNVFRKKENILNEEELTKLLEKYDIIVAPRGYTWGSTVKKKYYQAHIKNDLDQCEEILKDKYPEYSDAYDKVMNGNHYSPFNMIITKKKILDSYCAWLFSIFSELEKKIDLNDDRSNYNKRVYGFISERLLNVWIMKNKQYKVKEVLVLNTEENFIKQKIEYIFKKIV